MASIEEQVTQIAHDFKTKKKCRIELGRRKYTVKQVSTRIATKISELRLEAFYWQKKTEQELPLKIVLKANNKVRYFQAKTAACYLMGNWSLFPLLLSLRTWFLSLGSSETIFAINQVGGNNPDHVFFSAGLQSAKDQQKQFTTLLSDNMGEYQKRLQSAEAMVQADLGQSQEYK